MCNVHDALNDNFISKYYRIYRRVSLKKRERERDVYMYIERGLCMLTKFSIAEFHPLRKKEVYALAHCTMTKAEANFYQNAEKEKNPSNRKYLLQNFGKSAYKSLKLLAHWGIHLSLPTTI